MLPFDDATALVFGCGDAPPLPGLSIAGDLSICVNMAHRKHGVTPDVSFWIDGGMFDRDPEHFNETLCVCDVSAQSNQCRGWQIPIAGRGGRLPKWPRPDRLILRANSAVVAGVWALSLGCTLVGMIGCGCVDDGRPAHQMHAMRRARDEAAAIYDKPGQAEILFIDNLGDWMTFRQRNTGAMRILDAGDRIREFYQ